MTLIPELITALSSLAPLLVAIGGIATVHYRYRGARESAIEDAKIEARATFSRLFDEERTRRDAERAQHIAELERRDAKHEAEVQRIEREAAEDFERRWALRESELRAEHARQVSAWRVEMVAAVRDVARLIAQLDPDRTPTPDELARLREALARGGVSRSDINGLIAARGVAT